MKKASLFAILLLAALSASSILAHVGAQPQVIGLPAWAWHAKAEEYGNTNAGLFRIDVDPAASGDQQIVVVGPGQTVTINYTAWIYGWGSGGYEIRQLWFAYSWASSWPPWDAYTGIYDGIPHGNRTVGPSSFSIAAPTTPGTYKIWLCCESHYSMIQAVAGQIHPPKMLPHAIVIVLPQSYLTLRLTPTSAHRGQQLNFSGLLTPNMTTTIYLFYQLRGTPNWVLLATMSTDKYGFYSWMVTIPMSAPLTTVHFLAYWPGSPGYDPIISNNGIPVSLTIT